MASLPHLHDQGKISAAADAKEKGGTSADGPVNNDFEDLRQSTKTSKQNHGLDIAAENTGEDENNDDEDNIVKVPRKTTMEDTLLRRTLAKMTGSRLQRTMARVTITTGRTTMKSFWSDTHEFIYFVSRIRCVFLLQTEHLPCPGS